VAPRPPTRRGEEGVTLVLLIASLAIMLILMGAAAPTWRHIMQDSREQELYFRGNQIAQAIEEFQRKNGGAYPTTMERLVEGKFLRKLYKDPMTRDGKWRIVRQGEVVPGTAGPGVGPGIGASPRPGASPSATPEPEASPSRLGGPAGTGVGPIVGVASTSRAESLRVFNGRRRYDQWLFLAGQPRRLGRQLGGPSSLPGGNIRPSPR
jgi:type II secretory pathway pseudopilin PulG